MEAPEKFYLLPNGFISYFRNTDEDIEYIRTDTIIEKACEGIEHLLGGYIIRNFNFGDSYKIDTLIKEIKKYMKEE